MAFGIFGNKDGPLEKLASGKVKNDQEKQQLLVALTQGGGPSAEELVPLVLLDDATVTSRVIPMFATKASEAAVAALLEEALGRNLTVAAVRVLSKVDAHVVSPALEPLLSNPRADQVRKVWELALDLPAQVSDPLLEQALSSAAPPQRVIALKRLIKLKGTAALKPLLMEQSANREASVRKEALTALSSLQGDDVFGVMLERVSADDSKEVRDLASAWLQRYITQAPPDVRPRVLGKLVLAGTPEQRTALVRSMFTPSTAAELLLGVLTFCKSLTGQQHRTVMEALKTVGDLLIQPTMQLLSSNDADMRVQAVYLLEAYADPRTLGALLQTLGDADWWVRIVACETIGRIKDPRTLGPLSKLFSDGDAKWAAIDAVAAIGGSEALALLMPLLNDPTAEVRGAVVTGLKRVRDPRVEQVLTDVSQKDASVDVRLKAVDALRALRGGVGPGNATVVTSKELTKPVERLLAYARERGASDLHITPGEPPVVRLNGALQRLEGTQKVEPEASKALLLDLLDPVRKPIFDRLGAVDFCYAIPGVGRYRANVFRMKRGYAGVFRTIPNQAPSLAELGLPRKMQEIGTYHQGIVLVTGPAGSGKTTTLAALVNIINETRAAHVLTFEDPVEYVHLPKQALINQREMGKDSRSYASAMRGALREDPDVIVVGDMRDPETIRLALLASETGHLVIATMQTTGAAASIDKLIESFPPEEQAQVRVALSESFKLILSQVLVPRVSGGRTAVFELLTSTSSVRSLIREGKVFQLPSAMMIGRAAGMQTLDGALEEKVRSGEISYETGLSFAQNKESFSKLQSVMVQKAAPPAAAAATPRAQPPQRPSAPPVAQAPVASAPRPAAAQAPGAPARPAPQALAQPPAAVPQQRPPGAPGQPSGARPGTTGTAPQYQPPRGGKP